MPTYDYRCRECGYTFEEFQSMKSELLVKCPSCGKPALKRLMASGVGMIFKGSGFYQTDYKNTGSVSGNSTSTSESSKSEKKPGKPATSEETKSEKKSDSPAKSDSPKSDKRSSSK